MHFKKKKKKKKKNSAVSSNSKKGVGTLVQSNTVSLYFHRPWEYILLLLSDYYDSHKDDLRWLASINRFTLSWVFLGFLLRHFLNDYP